jgi:hypothetical protein
MASTQATKEAMWMTKLMKELGYMKKMKKKKLIKLVKIMTKFLLRH